MALELGLDQVQQQLERIAKLPKPYRIALLPALVAVVLGLYGYLFYAPAHGELQRVQKQEQELQRKVSEVRSIVSNLAAFEQELADLERELKHALRQLPDRKELPVLLTDISSLGKDAGLEFEAFRPRDEVERGFYAEVPIEIEFSGGYHDIARFFDRVASLPRIVNVGRLEMSIEDQQADATRLQVRGEATTFRFIDRGPSPTEQAKKPTARVNRPRGGRS
jgi:type IV pilus assembly protein PilO